jgi:DNA polymerase mu
MPFKRPLSEHTSDDSESMSSHDGRLDKPLLVYIVQAKIHPETMSELALLVENYQIERVNEKGSSVVSERNLELTGDVEKADIIVTATNMRQRLERHIDWRTAVCDHIVCHLDRVLSSISFTENKGHRNTIMASRFCKVRPASSLRQLYCNS